MNEVEHQVRQRIDEYAVHAATHVATQTSFTQAGLVNSSERELLILVLHELVAVRRELETAVEAVTRTTTT